MDSAYGFFGNFSPSAGLPSASRDLGLYVYMDSRVALRRRPSVVMFSVLIVGGSCLGSPAKRTNGEYRGFVLCAHDMNNPKSDIVLLTSVTGASRYIQKNMRDTIMLMMRRSGKVDCFSRFGSID